MRAERLPARPRPPGWLAAAAGALAVAAVAAALFFPRLGEAPLFGDEAIHALVARESAERDGLLPPTYDSRPYLAKPPLKILAVAWIFDRFGASELHARVLDAGFGVATVVVVFLFGRRLWGGWVGALAALLLATAERYVFDHGVRSGVQDSALVLLVTVGLALYFLRPRAARLPLAASGLAFGLATLVKGAAAALALPVLGAWELVRGRRQDGTRAGFRDGARDLAVVASLALACYLVWVAAAWSWSEGTIFSRLYRDTVSRAVESLDPSHVHGPAFYPLQLAADFGPWLLALLPALLVLRPGGGPERAEGDGRLDRDGLAFAGLWALVLLALLSLSVSKLPWYLYPAYPALGLVLARGVAEAVRRARRVPLLAPALVALVLVGLWQRLDGVRSRLEEEPRPVTAQRYAAAIAGLPDARLLMDRRLELRAWELYYLAPLAERPWRLPPDFRAGSPGVCRLLLWRWPWAPGHVETRGPVPALPLASPGEEPRAWLLDLDRCLPPWL